MAVVKHGVSSDTPDRMVFGPGAVYFGSGDPDGPGTLLGAAMGGSVLEINPTVRDIRPDGSIGKVKGFRRTTDVEIRLTVNLLEITEYNLLYLIPGLSASTHVITGAQIDDNDFIPNVALVLEHTGFTMTTAPLRVKLSNCIAEGPITMSPNNNEEMVISVTFVAHFSDSDLSTWPVEITYPS